MAIALSRWLRRAARSAARRARNWMLDRLFGTLVSVEVDHPLVALTFDDGPDSVTTPKVLDVLERHGARATFFMVGTAALRHPELVARIASAGHAIGHHTLDHESLYGLDRIACHTQIIGGYTAIGPACSKLFRPPFGHLGPTAWWTARRHGHEVVAWSGHALDWTAQDAGSLADRLRACLRPGAIILLHDAPQPCDGAAKHARSELLDALEDLLSTAHPGWRFVTVPALLASGRPRRVFWQLPISVPGGTGTQVTATDPGVTAP